MGQGDGRTLLKQSHIVVIRESAATDCTHDTADLVWQ